VQEGCYGATAGNLHDAGNRHLFTPLQLWPLHQPASSRETAILPAATEPVAVSCIPPQSWFCSFAQQFTLFLAMQNFAMFGMRWLEKIF
jgi:hypothetical protein